MRHKKAVSMWDWVGKITDTDQPGSPGRRFGHRVVPGGEKLLPENMCRRSKTHLRKKFQNQRGNKWFHEESLAMGKFIREELNKKPPVSPTSRWMPCKTENGSSLEKLKGDSVPKQHAMPKGDTAIDNRAPYGKDLDFESVAQFNSRVESYSRD